jgi:hypothetical protein
MASSGMLCRVALVRTDVSEERIASFIKVTRIGDLGTTLAVTSNDVRCEEMSRLLVTASVVPTSPILVTTMKEALHSFEKSVLTRATLRNIPEDTILKFTATFEHTIPVLELTNIYYLGQSGYSDRLITMYILI